MNELQQAPAVTHGEVRDIAEHEGRQYVVIAENPNYATLAAADNGCFPNDEIVRVEHGRYEVVRSFADEAMRLVNGTRAAVLQQRETLAKIAYVAAVTQAWIDAGGLTWEALKAAAADQPDGRPNPFLRDAYAVADAIIAFFAPAALELAAKVRAALPPRLEDSTSADYIADVFQRHGVPVNDSYSAAREIVDLMDGWYAADPEMARRDLGDRLAAFEAQATDADLAPIIASLGEPAYPSLTVRNVLAHAGKVLGREGPHV